MTARQGRAVRRLEGISVEILAFVLVTVLLPCWSRSQRIVDLVLWLRRRKPWVGDPADAFLWWFLLGEMARRGRPRIWLTQRRPVPRRLRAPAARHLQPAVVVDRATTWPGSATSSGCGSRSRTSRRPGPGRSIVMIRHASIIDNTLPDTLVATSMGSACAT